MIIPRFDLLFFKIQNKGLFDNRFQQLMNIGYG
jgi:hypothetical protein